MRVLFPALFSLLVACTPYIDGLTEGEEDWLGQTLLHGHKGRVLLFLSPSCPLSQGYATEIARLDSLFKKDDVLFTAVFPGKDADAANAKEFLKEFDIPTDIIIDSSGILTEAMKATITPEAFLINSDGNTIYSGRIDNWAYDIGQKRALVTEHDLENAIRDHLAGLTIRVAKTQAIGCFIEKK